MLEVDPGENLHLLLSAGIVLSLTCRSTFLAIVARPSSSASCETSIIVTGKSVLREDVRDTVTHPSGSNNRDAVGHALHSIRRR